MSSNSVDSKFYSLYIDTGMFVSLAPSPLGGSSTYFQDEAAEILKIITSYMPIIDLWVQDEIYVHDMPILAFGTAGYKVNLSYACSSTLLSFSGSQTVTLLFKTPISEQIKAKLQQRLCQWKEAHQDSNLKPATVVRTPRAEEQLPFGVFQIYPNNIREDLLHMHEEAKRNNAMKLINVLTKAVSAVEKKFQTTLHNEKPEKNDTYFVKEEYASWGGIHFTTWVVE